MATTITIDPLELEAIIRRAVRKELVEFVTQTRSSILYDWRHEGPEDVDGDQRLAEESLVVLEDYQKNRMGGKTWREFEAELEAAEAKGELPT